MALEWTATDTYNFVDQKNHMMLRKDLPWEINIGDFGKGDALGSNFMGIISYNDKRFIEAIKRCWVKMDSSIYQKIFGMDYYYQGYRYPDHTSELKNISRDHTTYTILALKYSGYTDDQLLEFVTHIPFKISDATEDSKNARFTPNMWLWARAISGSKIDEKLYYSVEIPIMKIVRTWTKYIYKKYKLGEELRPENFYMIEKKNKPIKILKANDTLFPVYALHQSAWQLHMLPDSDKKKKLQSILLDITPKHNYVIKMLLGDKTSFTEKDVMDYQPMTGGRWTNILVPLLCNRWTELIGVPGVVMSDPNLIKANVLDVDYLRQIYNTIVVHNSSFRNMY